MYVNEAEYDPFLRRQTERIESRLDNPEEATRRATSRFERANESSSRGQLRAAGANLSQSGGSLSPLARQRLMRTQRESRARSKADIEVGREKDEDSMLLGAGSALTALGSANREDRAAALEDQRMRRASYEAARQLGLAAQAQRLQEWMAKINALEMAG